MVATYASTSDSLTVKFSGPIGEVDAHTVDEAFGRAKSSDLKNVFVDLVDVPTISSAGIGKLIALHRALSAQTRNMVIRGCHDNLLTQFKSIHIDKILHIERN